MPTLIRFKHNVAHSSCDGLTVWPAFSMSSETESGGSSKDAPKEWFSMADIQKWKSAGWQSSAVPHRDQKKAVVTDQKEEVVTMVTSDESKRRRLLKQPLPVGLVMTPMTPKQPASAPPVHCLAQKLDKKKDEANKLAEEADKGCDSSPEDTDIDKIMKGKKPLPRPLPMKSQAKARPRTYATDHQSTLDHYRKYHGVL